MPFLPITTTINLFTYALFTYTYDLFTYALFTYTYGLFTYTYLVPMPFLPIPT